MVILVRLPRTCENHLYSSRGQSHLESEVPVPKSKSSYCISSCEEHPWKARLVCSCSWLDSVFFCAGQVLTRADTVSTKYNDFVHMPSLLKLSFLFSF